MRINEGEVMGYLKIVVQKVKVEDYDWTSKKGAKRGLFRPFSKIEDCKRNVNCRIGYSLTRGNYQKVKNYISNVCEYMLSADESKYKEMAKSCDDLTQKVCAELDVDLKIQEIAFVEYYTVTYSSVNKSVETKVTKPIVLAQSEAKQDGYNV